MENYKKLWDLSSDIEQNCINREKCSENIIIGIFKKHRLTQTEKQLSRHLLRRYCYLKLFNKNFETEDFGKRNAEFMLEIFNTFSWSEIISKTNNKISSEKLSELNSLLLKELVIERIIYAITIAILKTG